MNKDKICLKSNYFQCVYVGEPVSKNFVFQTIVSQLTRCLKFMTFREGYFVIRN